MGFRTSFYRTSIEYINKLQNTKIELDEFGYYYPDIDENSVYQMIYDCFTNSILDCSNNREYMTPIYESDHVNPDQIYYRMDANQFKAFIKYVFTKYANAIKDRWIKIEDFDTLKDEIKNGYDPDAIKGKFLKYNELPVIEKMISNQLDKNTMDSFIIEESKSLDNIFDNPWRISLCWGTYMSILNLIHIYHMMDWEKDNILIIGG